MTKPLISDLAKGQQIGTRQISLSRADLLRYAAASGDHNPIHWNERFAQEVGLEGVIAHGMLTMAVAVELVTDWAGDPGAVVDYQTRFTQPVLVPDAATGSPEQKTATIEVTGTIGAIDEQAQTARVDLAVYFLPQPAPGAVAQPAETSPADGEPAESQPAQTPAVRVLTKAQAVVLLKHNTWHNR